MIQTLIIAGLIVWALWPSATPPAIVNPPKKSGPTPAEVLEPLIADTPTPGRFFKLYLNAPDAAGNDGVLAQALRTIDNGAAANGTRRLQYLEQMTREWNAELYSRNEPTDAWPAAYNFDGINIGPAWLPRHNDAVAAISIGRMPQRNITAGGAKSGPGGSFGLIWLPPLDADALKAGSVVVTTNADGSSGLNPPATLLDLLE